MRRIHPLDFDHPDHPWRMAMYHMEKRPNPLQLTTEAHVRYAAEHLYARLLKP
jgi:hypothetical protein